jgi:hypothetical protein
LFAKTPPKPPRINVHLDAERIAFAKAELGPGRLASSISHYAELGIGLIQDEVALLQAWCKASGKRFDEKRYWRIHAAELEASVPRQGRPRKGDTTERVLISLYLDADMMDWIRKRAQPDGPFASHSPVPHAVEAGMRLMEQHATGRHRVARYGFDEDDLVKRYLQA